MLQHFTAVFAQSGNDLAKAGFLVTWFPGLFSSTNSNMRAAIYARVSTKDQSCEMQMRDLRAYCAARGFTIIREYVDIGQSGAKDSRPQLNELMADARKRKFDSILVWRFDRFARSTKHLLLALEEFRSLGIQFISYQENIDTNSPLGQALFTIVAAVSQLERDLIRERVSAGLRNARENGKRLGRPCVKADMDEILRLRAEGRSFRKIAATLAIGEATVRERLKSQRGKPQENSA
jgi:DNA invertase Pin-like site-specific DNA recombinase